MDSLAELRDRLVDVGQEIEKLKDTNRWEEFTKGIPPIAFQVARETRALVGQLEGAEGREDDFR